MKTISTLMANELGQETIDEKRSDLSELRLNGQVGAKIEDEDEKKPNLETTRVRGIAARANFLAQDRVGHSFRKREWRRPACKTETHLSDLAGTELCTRES